MKITMLFSGSEGNCALISDADTKILIDAGGCAKRIKCALESVDASIDDINATFITHEHTDHTKALYTLSKNFDIPIYTAENTAREICSLKKAPRTSLEKVARLIRTVESGQTYEVGSFLITPFAIPHDAVSPLGFEIKSQTTGERITYATDTGSVTRSMLPYFEGCDIALIESNHDIEMLKNGPYPEFLKTRILSNVGHLSNENASRFAVWLSKNGTKKIALAHLSRENNTPDTAESFAKTALFEANCTDTSISLALQDKLCEVEI